MKALSRHLPLIMSCIEFRLDGIAHAPPLITPRIDFSEALAAQQNTTEDIIPENYPNHIKDSNSSDDARYGDEHEASPSQQGDGDEEFFSSTSVKIPKPNGEPGRPRSGGYNLDEELAAWDAGMLSNVNSYVKTKAKQILNLTKSYSRQDPHKLAEVCFLTSREYPIVEKYDNYWPVRDMLKLHLKYTSETYRKHTGR
ncbi:hypothetical protein CPB84DRAFT_1753136 [Gymnopilus junonius]|uniref:Uncharacterized protein n=1 Tax=Gymnopilus junonius TaxID=109634 RepID=A0A9P5N9C5_GYMJU|nr:hypothetical protein CPB84DRAFT_1753136 [Gymnopilus junonius]